MIDSIQVVTVVFLLSDNIPSVLYVRYLIEPGRPMYVLELGFFETFDLSS